MARSGGSKQRSANDRHAEGNGGAVNGVSSDGARLRMPPVLFPIVVVVVAVWWAATRGHVSDADLNVTIGGPKHGTGSRELMLMLNMIITRACTRVQCACGLNTDHAVISVRLSLCLG